MNKPLGIDVQETERYFVVSFPYDASIVAGIQDIPGRQWHAATRQWRVPLAQRKSLQRLVAKYESPERAAEVLPTVSMDTSTVYPTAMRTTLWQHQLDTLRAVWYKDAALIDADMRSGKSATMVAYVLNKPDVWRVLIVCPHAVVDVWKTQFEVHGGKPVVMAQLDKGSVAKKTVEAQRVCKEAHRRDRIAVIVVNYESLWRAPFAAWALDTKLDLLILDEVHALSTPGTKVSRFVQRLAKQVPVRFGLSGTLLRNSPLDAYGVSRAVGSVEFGTRHDVFKRSYATWHGFQNRVVKDYINQDVLRQKLNTVRVVVRPGGYSLPATLHTDVVLEFPDKVRKLYDKLAKDFYIEVAGGELSVANAAVMITRLQAVCQGFLPVVDAAGLTVIEELHKLKEDALQGILDALPLQEKVIVFARFTHDLLAIHRVARAAQRRSQELSGRVPMVGRSKALDEWKEDNHTTVLAVQLQVGSEGLDCSAANYCVYYSHSFSLKDYKQSQARLLKPDKQHACFYDHLLVRGGVDTRIKLALERKENVIEALMKGDAK